MSAEMKPYLLLDVDGVLNVYPAPLRDGEEHFNIEVDGWSIWYTPSVIKRLAALSDHVELLWLTTWREKAPRFIAPALGLPDFGVVPHDINQPTRIAEWPLNWWKLDAADDLIRDNERRVIWCDDDLEPEIQDEARRRYGNDRLLLVNPRPSPGLTHGHLDLIEAFVDDDA